MKVYLAARYDRRDEMRKYRKILNLSGIEVTSRWLDETGSLDGNMEPNQAVFLCKHAVIDLGDIDDADAIVLFSENPLEAFRRGGRHVEFGYALRAGKAMYIIGPKENIFHYLGYVKHFDTFEELVFELRHQLRVKHERSGISR